MRFAGRSSKAANALIQKILRGIAMQFPQNDANKESFTLSVLNFIKILNEKHNFVTINVYYIIQNKLKIIIGGI